MTMDVHCMMVLLSVAMDGTRGCVARSELT